MTPTEATFEDFFSAYVECALGSELDENGQPLDREFEAKDIDPDTLLRMRSDCVAFFGAMSETYCDQYKVESRYSDHELAGHDFWLTRNRHGAGFWDGDWNDEVSDALDKAAYDAGEFNLYVGDDNKIHGTGG